tara:strand:+ start:281 stop:592 length:312 start_codon:yes stop_codon:yes gene_type:complete
MEYEVCQCCGQNDQEVDICGSGKHGICSDCCIDGSTQEDIPTKFFVKFNGILQVDPRYLKTTRVGDKMVINDLGELIQNAESVKAEAEVIYDGLTLYEADYNI